VTMQTWQSSKRCVVCAWQLPDAPTVGSFGGGVGACALAGTAAATVTVAAASTEPAMPAQAQTSHRPLSSCGIPGKRPAARTGDTDCVQTDTLSH
jgi:hypothetical protein